MLVPSAFGFAAPARAQSAPQQELRGQASQEFRGQPTSPELSAARSAYVQRLLALAQWCNANDLFLQRDKVFNEVLALEPDNLDARKGLRFSRGPDGSWRDPPPREMKDRNPKALADYPAKRSEAVAPLRDALLAALERENPDEARKQAVYDEILALDPGDARVHALRGEAKLGDHWVMAEIAAGKRRRAEIKEFAKTSLAQAIVGQAYAPSAEEAVLGATWKATLETPALRVLSTADEIESRRIAQVCSAIGPFASSIFGRPLELPADTAIYVLAEASEREVFVDKLPGLSLEQRIFMKASPSAFIAGSVHAAIFAEDSPSRIDAAARHALALLLNAGFGIGAKQGWVVEGVGLYLTRELIGTRATWFIPSAGKGAQSELRDYLKTPGSNWMNEGFQRLASDRAPQLGDVMTLELKAMSVEDMLMSYVLAAYCIEGRPKETPELLRMLGAGDSPSVAVQGVLGMTLQQLQERVTQWLANRR